MIESSPISRQGILHPSILGNTLYPISDVVSHSFSRRWASAPSNRFNRGFRSGVRSRIRPIVEAQAWRALIIGESGGLPCALL